MPQADTIPVFHVWEKGSVLVLARITGEAAANGVATPITQATITSIALKITELPSRTVVAPPEITVSDVVFDTMQTDDRWTIDAVGYNFAHWIDGATYLLTPSVIHRLEYTFTPSTTPGYVFPVLIDVSPRELIGT